MNCIVNEHIINEQLIDDELFGSNNHECNW